MKTTRTGLPEEGRPERILARRSFWVVAGLLAGLTGIHYLTSQERPLPAISHPLGRHAVERVIFILPVAAASFAFGQTGGLIVLALSILIMLPRSLVLSPYPADALAETIAVGVVGYLVVRMVERQEREKRMRQAVASRLGAINDVTRIVTGSLEMQQVLNSALARILEITNAQIALAYLLDGDNDELVLTACRGLIDGSERAIARLGPDDGVIGEVGQTGEPLVLDDAGSRPRSIPALAALEEASSFVAVPLRSSSRVLGVMALAGSRADPFTPQDVQLLIAIGGQIGVAVENVRLYESMRYYARQVTRAQEDERKRIARDLHDETMQALIAISRRIEGLTTGSKKQPADVARRLEELRGLAGDALKELRRFVRDLRPPALDHLGLMAALASLADDLRAESEIETEIDMIGQVRRLTPDQELGLFRIFQETLTNVRRHSGAHRVAVQVAFQPDRVQMIVRDDGRGFDAPERANGLMSTGGLGLVGMIERAHLLGGTLVIRSRPGEGTTVTVEVPT